MEAATLSDDDAVEVIDLSDRFCDDQACYPVVGDMIVYRDATHLTYAYTKALSPDIAARLAGSGLIPE